MWGRLPTVGIQHLPGDWRTNEGWGWWQLLKDILLGAHQQFLRELVHQGQGRGCVFNCQAHSTPHSCHASSGLGTACPFLRVPPYYLFTAWFHPELSICGLADLALLCVQTAWLTPRTWVLQVVKAAVRARLTSPVSFPSQLC
jgi:hypothetical protein